MKISVLETNMLTGGDISLSDLENLGDVDFYNKLDDAEIIRLCHDSDVILCTKTIFHKKLMDCLPSLKLICLFATGYNNVDVEYAHKKGILVANAPAYSTESVVQHVFSLLLNLAGNTYRYIESTFCGDWIKSPTFSYFNIPIIEIQNKTIGIVGYGAIGKRVAEICKKQNIDFAGVDIKEQSFKQQFDAECANCSVAIDFSSPDALEKNLEFCVKNTKK